MQVQRQPASAATDTAKDWMGIPLLTCNERANRRQPATEAGTRPRTLPRGRRQALLRRQPAPRRPRCGLARARVGRDRHEPRPRLDRRRRRPARRDLDRRHTAAITTAITTLPSQHQRQVQLQMTPRSSTVRRSRAVASAPVQARRAAAVRADFTVGPKHERV
jgi:hypothetical protein